MILLLLMSCEALESFEFLLYEVRQPVTEVSYAGSVLASTFDFETPFTGGTMTWLDMDGAELAVGEEPDPTNNPGYWTAVLPPETEFVLRVDGGEGYYPAVARGLSPAGNGLWFTGALFGWPAELTDPYFVDTALQLGVTLEPLVDGQVAYLWGAVHPDSIDVFEGGRLTVIDGDGEEAPVSAWIVDESGVFVPTDVPPADYFLAYNLAPGDVTVLYDGDDDTIETLYPDVQGGDVVTPWFYYVAP